MEYSIELKKLLSVKKNLKWKTISEHLNKLCFFSHPDYTVGFGITPNHALRLAGFTAGRDSHPALKNILNTYSI